MEMHMMTTEDKVLVYTDVTKIEVENIGNPEAGEETFFRKFRFVTNFGNVIELLCFAYEKKKLGLHRVKKLKPVKKPKPCEWQVYTGSISDESEEQESD
jgi:hypothetical protein